MVLLWFFSIKYASLMHNPHLLDPIPNGLALAKMDHDSSNVAFLSLRSCINDASAVDALYFELLNELIWHLYLCLKSIELPIYTLLFPFCIRMLHL
uniref:Uncharacterized protein n=1 Tax=Octopus bimaculoides TaxID=37653 RepID=A0A0L8HAX2_OCTBM